MLSASKLNDIKIVITVKQSHSFKQSDISDWKIKFDSLFAYSSAWNCDINI